MTTAVRRPPAREERHPFGAHAALMTAYAVVVGSGLVAAERTGRLPSRPNPLDIALLGAATAKGARLISRARVTMVLRRPFTEYHHDAGHGEVEESATGRGFHRAVGELLTCPYCLAPWIAAALGGLLLVRPRTGRTVTGLLAAAAVSDLVQERLSARA